MARALVVGDVMTDVVVRLEGPIAWGSDTPARIVERPGGSAATQAVWLARARIEVVFVGRVGAGDRERLAAELAEEGVIPWLAGDRQLPTGRLIAIVEPNGDRSFLTDRGANDALDSADIPGQVLASANWLHLTGYTFQQPGPRAVALDLIRHSRGVPVSLDPGSAAPLRAMGVENFLSWTEGVSMLLANADEAAALSGTDDPTLQGQRLAARYELAVIKRGAAGAEAFSGDRRWTQPSPTARVVDTTGAGDAFAAAFIAARMAGEDIGACLARATAAGAAATTFLGGRPDRTL